MKKLYFISFNNENKFNNYYGNYWAKKEREAIELFLIDYNLEYQELNKDNFTCYQVDNAIHKEDITNALNRYIIKQLNK